MALRTARIEKARVCWYVELNGFEFNIDIDDNVEYYYKCDNLECNHIMKLKFRNIRNKKNIWCNHTTFKNGYICYNSDNTNENYCKICYERSFATSQYAYKWSVNNKQIIHDIEYPLLACHVSKSSNMYYLYYCNKCDHEYEAIGANINKGSNCPYCGTDKVSGRAVCGDINCNMCFVKSLQHNYPDIAELWVREKNIIENDNGEITYLEPHMVAQQSHIVCWFRCKNPDCNHIHDAKVKDMVKNIGCKYCSSSGEVCGDTECNKCYDLSFANHPKAVHWNLEMNTKTPIQLRLNSNDKCYFDCNVCMHTFDMLLYAITGEQQQWCPYCNGNRLCGSLECNMCFNKSYASCPMINYYSRSRNIDENGVYISPLMVRKRSSEKRWFRCNLCNHYNESEVKNNCGNRIQCTSC
jgi:hypothetical protein